MHLQERLAHDLKDAMRARDQVRLLTIRALIAALTEKEKEGSGPVTEEQATAVVQRQAKQRRDAAEQFEAAGREDLAQKERDELEIIARYLPAQLSEDDIRREVHEIIARTGATTRKDMGRVMGEAMSRLKGRAEGQRVRAVVEAILEE